MVNAMNIDDLMQQLTFTTRGTLEMCGWTPVRKVDTSEYIRTLRAKGLRVHDIAIDFLVSFGGLVLCVPHPYVPSYAMDVCFDPIQGANSEADLQWWDGFQRVTGIQLTLIGWSGDHRELLSIDCNGAMYSNDETAFVRIGDSLATSLNALCEARPVPERLDYDKRLAFGT
jgi:hypothetical protein